MIFSFYDSASFHSFIFSGVMQHLLAYAIIIDPVSLNSTRSSVLCNHYHFDSVMIILFLL